MIKPRSQTVYVNLKAKRGREIHEFFIRDRWHRMEVPPGYTKAELEKILNRHLRSKTNPLHEGIQITSRARSNV